MNDYWCIPSKEDADFVACMEDVLDVYELPYDPMSPVVCMDEKPYQWCKIKWCMSGNSYQYFEKVY